LGKTNQFEMQQQRRRTIAGIALWWNTTFWTTGNQTEGKTKTDESAMQCLCGSEARTSLTDNQVNRILKRNLNSKHITAVHTPFRRFASVCVFRASWKGFYSHTYSHTLNKYSWFAHFSKVDLLRSKVTPQHKQERHFYLLMQMMERTIDGWSDGWMNRQKEW